MIKEILESCSRLIFCFMQVLVPEFYNEVAEVSQDEYATFDEIHLNIETYTKFVGVKNLIYSTAREILSSRWRQPTLSINTVNTSNYNDSATIIPKLASAKVSVRSVPDQKPEKIVELIRGHLKHEFGKRRSPNELSIEVKKIGDWWLADRSNASFRIAEEAVTEVWKQKPMFVREGGTMTITSFLERLLEAPAIHLPLGQSTDNAHLPNERIRYQNLMNGKEVMKKMLIKMGQETQVDASLVNLVPLRRACSLPTNLPPKDPLMSRASSKDLSSEASSNGLLRRGSSKDLDQGAATNGNGILRRGSSKDLDTGAPTHGIVGRGKGLNSGVPPSGHLRRGSTKDLDSGHPRTSLQTP